MWRRVRWGASCHGRQRVGGKASGHASRHCLRSKASARLDECGAEPDERVAQLGSELSPSLGSLRRVGAAHVLSPQQQDLPALPQATRPNNPRAPQQPRLVADAKPRPEAALARSVARRDRPDSRAHLHWCPSSQSCAHNPRRQRMYRRGQGRSSPGSAWPSSPPDPGRPAGCGSRDQCPEQQRSAHFLRVSERRTPPRADVPQIALSTSCTPLF
jgi:hypothetical protein